MKHICGHPYEPPLFRIYEEIEQALAPRVRCSNCIPEAERANERHRQKMEAAVLFQERSLNAGFPMLRGRTKRWEAEYIRGQHFAFLQLAKKDISNFLPNPPPELLKLVSTFEARFEEWNKSTVWRKQKSNMHLASTEVLSMEALVCFGVLRIKFTCRVCEAEISHELKGATAYQAMFTTCDHSSGRWRWARKRPIQSAFLFALTPEHIWIVRQQLRTDNLNELLPQWNSVVPEPPC